jgi:hypothetical protein
MMSFFEFLLEKAEYQAQPDESEVVHHASNSDFTEFHPLSHFGTANAARARAIYDTEPEDEGKKRTKPKNLYTARIKLGKVAHIADTDDEHTPITILDSLHDAGHIDKASHREYTTAMHKLHTDEDRKAVLLNALKKHKINTISYNNTVEDPGSRSYIISHPSQVRLLQKTKSPVDAVRGEKHLNDMW